MMFLHGAMMLFLLSLTPHGSWAMHDCTYYKHPYQKLTVKDIRISGCVQKPCHVYKNQSFSMEVDFVAPDNLKDKKFLMYPHMNNTWEQNPFPEKPFDIKIKWKSCEENIFKNPLSCSAKKGEVVTLIFQNYTIDYNDYEWPADRFYGSMYFLMIDKTLKEVTCEFKPIIFIDPKWVKKVNEIIVFGIKLGEV